MQRFKLFQVLILSVLVLGFAPGCDDDDDDNGGTNTDGNMTATVNGSTTYNFGTAGSAYQSGLIVIQGNAINVAAGQTRQITIRLTSLSGTVVPGEYDLSETNIFQTAIYAEGTSSTTPVTYSATAGKLIVETVSSAAIKGTFNFTGEDSQTGSSKIISDGSFDFNF